MSPGDVEDLGSDYEVPVDWSRLEETVEKAVTRVPILERATISQRLGRAAAADAGRARDHGRDPGPARLPSRCWLLRPRLPALPAAGKHLTELILDGRSSVDLSLFDPLRFERAGAETPTPQSEQMAD